MAILPAVQKVPFDEAWERILRGAGIPERMLTWSLFDQLQQVVGASSLTTGALISEVEDAENAVGFTMTTEALTEAGTKLLSVVNDATERMYLDKDGGLFLDAGCSVGAAIASSVGTFTSSVADGGSAIAFTLTSGTLANAAAKLLSIKNNTNEKLNVDLNGKVNAGATLALFLQGNIADGAAAKSVVVNAATTLANATAKILSVQNNAVEVVAWDLNGKEILASYASQAAGNQTNSRVSGRNKVANGASAVTVTNTLVSAATIVLCQLETASVGAAAVVVVPGSGSFVATAVDGDGAPVAVTGDATFSWKILN